MLTKILPNDPVISSIARTPIGKYGGALSSLRPDDMLAMAMNACINRAKIDRDLIEEVIAGCANQAGEDNRNIARMSSLIAGLNFKVSAITINRLCASGLDAIIMAARMVITGERSAVLACGVESMSRAPYVLAKSTIPFSLGSPEIFDSSLGWRFYNEKLKETAPKEHNGDTAERLSEMYKITRTDQDIFALNSHQKVIRAQEKNFFDAEIFPIEISKKNGEMVKLAKDEGPRIDTSIEALSTLKPSFKNNGTVTAGNSSPLSDGAACALVCSHSFAKKNNLPILGRILSFASAGVDPKTMGLGPVPATLKLLENSGLCIGDFEAIEINEAFSAQVLAVVKELGLQKEKINQNGGAIALGHPLGCSGARLVITLLNHLIKNKLPLGLATLCVGVGQGVSIAIEAL